MNTNRETDNNTASSDARYVASLDTGSYRFMALGRTADEARGAIQDAWVRHRTITGARYTWEDISDDLDVLCIEPGQATRDGSSF
jgi:hypothetical protein